MPELVRLYIDILFLLNPNATKMKNSSGIDFKYRLSIFSNLDKFEFKYPFIQIHERKNI